MNELRGHISDRYYHLYDDIDRYFDPIYDLYEQFQQESADFLEELRFIDFFDFIVAHLNRPKVDQMLINHHLRELKQELGSLRQYTTYHPTSTIIHRNYDPDS